MIKSVSWVEYKKNMKEAPVQINKGWIFKKARIIKDDRLSKGTGIENNRNRFSILSDFDKTECLNNIIVFNRLGSNIILQEKNKELCKTIAAV